MHTSMTRFIRTNNVNTVNSDVPYPPDDLRSIQYLLETYKHVEILRNPTRTHYLYETLVLTQTSPETITLKARMRAR